MAETERILIVDDDESTRKSLKLVFDKRGYETETAGTGREALEKAQERPFNLALLDLRLPDEEGVELLATLKVVQPRIAVIVVTGHASVETAVRALEEGAWGYITKPLDMNEVLARVRDVLERQRLVEEKRQAESQRDATLEALRQRNRELELLSRAAQAFISTLELDQVLTTVLDEVRRLLGVVACSVWLVDPETGSQAGSPGDLVCRQAVGPRSEIVRGWRLAPGEGIAGWVAQHGQSLIVPDARTDARHFAEVDAQTGLDLRSILSVPLQVKQDVIGVLQVVDTGADRFDAADLAVLEPLAASAAIVIENARLFEQVRSGRERLRQLTSYLQGAREEERTHIAREIHDEFGQALTALKMDLSWLSRRLPPGETHLLEKAEVMSDLVDDTIHMVRRVATELRPGVLDDLGLVAALEWQAQEFAGRTGIECELHLGQEDVTLGRDLYTTVFRIYQETLTNVARHAEASLVRVDLEIGLDELVLSVRDNGKGITGDEISDPKSLGLIGMRERARSCGGSITFQGVPGQGTTVTVQVPRLDSQEDGK
jgi:signal transduction histidine kinase/DNA-binding response OmpR family regulator